MSITTLALCEFAGSALYLVTSFLSLVVYDPVLVDPVTYQAYVASVFASCIVLAFLVTGAKHLNPAVTVAAVVADPVGAGKQAVPLIVAQLVGSMVAAWTVHTLLPDPGGGRSLFPVNSRRGTPVVTVAGAFALESLGTCVLAVATVAKTEMVLVAVAEAVFCVHLFLFHFTGCSVNPARALAAAVGAGDFREVWLFITAPLVGGVCAGLLQRLRAHARRAAGSVSV